MKPRDLSNLNALEFLDLAILAEEEAAERYGEFAEQMELHHNREAAALFREIQARELEHFQRLREQRRTKSAQSPTVEPLHFFDSVESPSYEAAHYKMGPLQIFQVALEGERRAVAFYKTLRETLKDEEAKIMAGECWEEEKRHVEQVEEGLSKLSPPSQGLEEDHDEPVPQA